MTLSTGEDVAIVATMILCLLLGFALGRAVFAAVPLTAGVGFLAVTIASDEVYSRIPEDLQIAIVAALFGGAICTLIGVLCRRWFDAGRRLRSRESI